jgi:hypothetical protein
MSIDEDAAMQRLVAELTVLFPTATLPQVDLLISGLRDLFRAAPIREFLPLLIRRAALDHFAGRTVLSFAERIGGGAPCPGVGPGVPSSCTPDAAAVGHRTAGRTFVAGGACAGPWQPGAPPCGGVTRPFAPANDR